MTRTTGTLASILSILIVSIALIRAHASDVDMGTAMNCIAALSIARDNLDDAGHMRSRAFRHLTDVQDWFLAPYLGQGTGAIYRPLKQALLTKPQEAAAVVTACLSIYDSKH